MIHTIYVELNILSKNVKLCFRSVYCLHNILYIKTLIRYINQLLNNAFYFSVPSSDLLLRLGEHDLSTESEPYLHQERRVQIVVPFPHFDNRTFEYDLALLRFYEPVTFQPNIIPVCVPDTDENFVGSTAYVTGWGRLYEGQYEQEIGL